jgi:hypothetical protein
MQVIKKTFFCYNHQGKAKEYIKALLEHGYFETRMALRAELVLIDVDDNTRVRRHINQVKNGGRLFVYPHAARAPIQWDGLFEPWPYTSAVFVSAPGHIDVLRAYGFKKPIHVAGWAYCPMGKFEPNLSPRKVLFAPIHPTSKSWLSELDQKINRDVYQRLLYLMNKGHIELHVRYMRGLKNNGIWHDDNVIFHEGGTDLCYKEIDEADVVISHQTHAYMAVARRKPTIMMAEDVAPRNGGSVEDFTFVKSWDKYKDLLMYPLDILNTEDPLQMIMDAAESDHQVADWRARMIGEPFNHALVAETMVKYLR